ncbi:MAG TPA: D-hexose-6-phosphate mutarotase [Longimicrobiaceae bacterium]
MPPDPRPSRDPATAPAASLPQLHLSHPSGGSVAVYLQGAHVASWRRPGGDEVLFMSGESHFEAGVPIRGGIPVVFPQFSDRGPLPKHGFARTLPWEVVETVTDPGGASRATLRLTDGAATRELWPHPFRAELVVTLDEGLATTLRITNTGKDVFTFTSALHTYYRVGDVRQLTVEGLEGARYLGAPGGEAVDADGMLRIRRETDGVYAGAGDRLRIVDPSLGRVLEVEKEGFADAVVWNPWVERARALPDFGDEEYLTMVCVEPANIAVPTRLGPGDVWSGTQKVLVREA